MGIISSTRQLEDGNSIYAIIYTMKTLTQHWLKLGESDYESAMYLYKGARYPQALYLLFLATEKLLKALIIEHTETVPEKIHRLENLAIKTACHFSGDQLNQLTELSRHYSRVRYPDIAQTAYNSKVKVEPIIHSASGIYLWIRQQFAAP